MYLWQSQMLMSVRLTQISVGIIQSALMYQVLSHAIVKMVITRQKKIPLAQVCMYIVHVYNKLVK